MTKQELNRYFWLQHEIKRQQKRLEKLKERRDRDKDTVGDTVRDYRSGKGIPVRIEGIPEESFSLPIMIGLMEEEITKNIAESQAAVYQIENYIQEVSEPRLRELLRSRFIDCKSWDEVSKANYIDKDHARRLIRTFLKNDLK